MKSGVYSITSPSGKRYVGSSVDVPDRWSEHLYRLRRGTHHNPGLSGAFAKYGEERLTFRHIIFCAPAHLLELEQLMIDTLRPEYNVNQTAGSTLGMKHSPEAKAKIAAAAKRAFTDEHRMRISAARRGMKLSSEHRENISKARQGISLKGRRAVKLTDEHKRAISEKLKGVPKSPEARANMLAARHARLERERAKQ